jgi:lysophospholipase L1-like esterase
MRGLLSDIRPSGGNDKEMTRAILIGDSIRLCYQDLVSRQCAGYAEVWGPEENGGTSRNVLARLKEWVLGRRPDLVHLNAGLHDIRREFGAAQPAVPLVEYRANLTEILRRVKEQTGAHAIWATMTPVNERRHHATKGFDRLSEDVLVYNRAAVEVCQELEVPVDNLFEVVMDAGADRLLGPDGVHFTEEGCRVLARAVADAICKSG